MNFEEYRDKNHLLITLEYAEKERIYLIEEILEITEKMNKLQKDYYDLQEENIYLRDSLGVS